LGGMGAGPFLNGNTARTQHLSDVTKHLTRKELNAELRRISIKSIGFVYLQAEND
jgi:hypothetical protein